jgi:hypothetical protein
MVRENVPLCVCFVGAELAIQALSWPMGFVESGATWQMGDATQGAAEGSLGSSNF